MSRSVLYKTSPLLASKTPLWRSKLVVAAMAFGFVGLGGRAVYVQVIGNDFFLAKGAGFHEIKIELPAMRGRILDRNGLILASSVLAPSIFANPKKMDRDPARLAKLAALLQMSKAELDAKLEDHQKQFVWLRRQVDEPVAQQIADLGIRGIDLQPDYKRQYPEGEAIAHVVGFTNIEDQGQEGIELEFNKALAGRAGKRSVLRDRLSRFVEATGEHVPPVDGKDIQLSIDSKVQFFAYQKLREAVTANKAKAG
ncbi:MAG: penicillin-binding protein 2, partial [Burkholderiales bacterium]